MKKIVKIVPLLCIFGIINAACTRPSKTASEVPVADTLMVDTLPAPVTEFVRVDSLNLDTVESFLSGLPDDAMTTTETKEIVGKVLPPDTAQQMPDR